MSLHTSSKSNVPFSRSICAWNTIWRSRSPSSSRSISGLFLSMPSHTSYVSSMRSVRILSWVCTLSQGQPFSDRSSSMICLRSFISYLSLKSKFTIKSPHLSKLVVKPSEGDTFYILPYFCGFFKCFCEKKARLFINWRFPRKSLLIISDIP